MLKLLEVRSVAGQVFLLQLMLVVLLVAAAVVALALQSRWESTEEARNRSLDIAKTLAYSPETVEALDSTDPSAALQPRAERIRRGTGADLVVVYSTDGIRHTHSDPDLIGKPVPESLEPPRSGATRTLETAQGPSVISSVPVTRADGTAVGTVAVAITVKHVEGMAVVQGPILLGAAAGALALSAGGTALVSRRLLRQTHGLVPAEMTRMYEHHDAVLHSVREGVLIIDGDGRLLLANDEARRLLDLPADAEQRRVSDLDLDAGITELLASDRTATDEVYLAADRLLAVNKRSTAPHGGQAGSAVTLRDTTELRALSGKAEGARERLRLLYDAGARMGTTLDVRRTAEELAQVAVPRFADIVTVELAEAVLCGEEPAGAGTDMRRTAVSGIRADQPPIPTGEPIDFGPGTPQARCVESGHAVLEADVSTAHVWQALDPERAGHVPDHGVHSLIAVPLKARGTVLGIVEFWRSERAEPFEEEDVPFAEELAARAGMALDNARRYTREHTMAVTLQRSLLPRALPEQTALDVAYRYLPAQAGVGGDWFDVIPLPGTRVALVIGDVVGHGLHAAATMGQLRTAVHNFSALDLPPDEILGHLDELVARIDQDHSEQTEDAVVVTGATCLYAIYDPVAGRVALARAGHLGPGLVHPDGTVTFPDLPVSPPLGLGGEPFETAELQLSEGSLLALYTDGLVENRNRDIDTGLDLLRAALTEAPGRDAERTCQTVFDALTPARPRDDVALLVARTRLLSPEQVAEWDVPSDPAAVAPVRTACVRQVEAWGLEEISFATGLILSELITNAVRYGAPPIHVRLLHDRGLICEISDGSSTSPHLRRAKTTDEGGRGLFLVAQYTERWGTRYTSRGKVIWTEQTLRNGIERPAGGPDLADVLLERWDE